MATSKQLTKAVYYTVLAICVAPSVGLYQGVPMPAPAAPNPMVWQQGINSSANWQQLGCPHDYESDAEKERMIQRGLCKNVTPKPTRSPTNSRQHRKIWPPIYQEKNMANIKLQNLTSLAGADLFSDTESFMQDLSENELVDLQGGKAPRITAQLSIFCRPTPRPTPPIFIGD
jgi:hypothetical protein